MAAAFLPVVVVMLMAAALLPVVVVMLMAAAFLSVVVVMLMAAALLSVVVMMLMTAAFLSVMAVMLMAAAFLPVVVVMMVRMLLLGALQHLFHHVLQGIRPLYALQDSPALQLCKGCGNDRSLIIVLLNQRHALLQLSGIYFVRPA